LLWLRLRLSRLCPEEVCTSAVPQALGSVAAMKSTISAHMLLACMVHAGAIALQASEVAVRTWLREHPAGAQSEDGLAELKTANPDAYAIVKSLLMKRSLGLLDPKHPSASFAKTPTSDSAPLEASASVDSTSADASVDVSAMPASSAGAHKDWLNWKPQDSAANDEAMVNSVLGAVAQIKGGQSSTAVNSAPQPSATPDTSGPLELKASDATSAVTAAEAPAVPVPQPVAVAPVTKAASSVASGGDDVNQQAVPLQPAVEQQNSYLAAVDLDAPRPHEAAKSRKHAQLLDSTNYLSSFSWGDDGQQPKAVAGPPKPLPHVASTAASAPATPATPAQHKGALLAWLGGDSEPKVSKKAVPTQPPQPENPYSAFLA